MNMRELNQKVTDLRELVWNTLKLVGVLLIVVVGLVIAYAFFFNPKLFDFVVGVLFFIGITVGIVLFVSFLPKQRRRTPEEELSYNKRTAELEAERDMQNRRW